MSEDVASPTEPRVNSWPLVWLVGGLVPLLIGAVPISMWIAEELDNLDPENPVFDPPWWDHLGSVMTIGAVIAFPTSLLLTLIAFAAEAQRPRSLLLWLGLGIVATSPVALFFFAASPSAALALYGLGLVGAAAAWWTRRGWRFR